MSEFRVTARPYDDEATFENLGYPHKHTCNGCPRCDIFCYRIMADYAAGDYKLASARLDSVTKQLFPHRFEDMTTYDRPVHEQVAANQFRSNVPPSRMPSCRGNM